MKYKVGDKVTLTNGDIMTVDQINDKFKWYFMREDPLNCYTDEMIECKVEEETKSEDGLLDEYEELTDRAFKGGYEKCKSDIELNGFQLPEGYQFVDENGNEIFTSKIILKKKKQKYPKTYVECAKILDCFSAAHIDGYKNALLEKLQELLICRDAYWKIAGEEIGLDKPWEPDWYDDDTVKYCIIVDSGIISKQNFRNYQFILAIPTEEMRDAFKENFDPDIEICKEFL